MDLDENTIWYDRIINQFIQSNEHSELATPLQEGAETKTQTASTEASKSTTCPVQEVSHGSSKRRPFVL